MAKFKLVEDTRKGSVMRAGIVYVVNPATKVAEFGIVVGGGRQVAVWFPGMGDFNYYKLDWSSILNSYKNFLPHTDLGRAGPMISGMAREWFVTFFKGKTPKNVSAPNFDDWVLDEITVGDTASFRVSGNRGSIGWQGKITKIAGGMIYHDNPQEGVPPMVKPSGIDSIVQKASKVSVKKKIDAALPKKATKTAKQVAPAFKVGDKVKAKWQDGKFYPATIQVVNSKGAIVKWADGTKPSGVVAADIKPVK